MENILKPKGMLCNVKSYAGQLVDRSTYLVDWLTGQHSG